MMLFTVQTKSLVHKVYPGGGSCFAAPCVDSTTGLVYCATLQGTVAAINTVRCVVKAHLLSYLSKRVVKTVTVIVKINTGRFIQ